MSYEVLTRDYSVRFWRSKCPGIQSFQHFNLLKCCTRNYAPLESSDLHAPGTSDLIGFSVPCILPTMLCFFVLISSATFILKKKIILPLIWTELGEKTLPLRRSTGLNTVIKMSKHANESDIWGRMQGWLKILIYSLRNLILIPRSNGVSTSHSDWIQLLPCQQHHRSLPGCSDWDSAGETSLWKLSHPIPAHSVNSNHLVTF